MPKKQRYKVQVAFRIKKTIITMLEKTEATQISSSPLKSGGYNIFFSVKKESVKLEIENQFAELKYVLEKIDG